MPTATKTATCKCLEQVQAQLDGCHVVVESLINFKTGKIRPSPPSLRVAKNDPKSRKAATVLFCAYCPFCGKKYPK